MSKRRAGTAESKGAPVPDTLDPDPEFHARLFSTQFLCGIERLGTDINALLGATTFYNAGYTGTNAAVANIEAGHVWSGHETLTTTVQIPNHASSLNEVDRHATWVGMIMSGRQAGANPGSYQQGMAPDSQLFSGALSETLILHQIGCTRNQALELAPCGTPDDHDHVVRVDACEVLRPCRLGERLLQPVAV